MSEGEKRRIKDIIEFIGENIKALRKEDPAKAIMFKAYKEQFEETGELSPGQVSFLKDEIYESAMKGLGLGGAAGRRHDNKIKLRY